MREKGQRGPKDTSSASVIVVVVVVVVVVVINVIYGRRISSFENYHGADGRTDFGAN